MAEEKTRRDIIKEYKTGIYKEGIGTGIAAITAFCATKDALNGRFDNFIVYGATLGAVALVKTAHWLSKRKGKDRISELEFELGLSELKNPSIIN